MGQIGSGALQGDAGSTGALKVGEGLCQRSRGALRAGLSSCCAGASKGGLARARVARAEVGQDEGSDRNTGLSGTR